MVRLAIIGVGWQGQGLLSHLAQIPEASVVGACDLQVELLAKVEHKYGVRGFTEYEEMFDTVRPDGVLICTHPQVRLPFVRAAAERGIHCFIEKPPAWDFETALRIQQMLEEAGVFSSVGFMYRYSQAVAQVRELLRGRRIALIRSCMLDGLAVREGTPAWFFDKRKSGGPVFDQAIHMFDLSRYLVGEVHAVAGFHSNPTIPKSKGFTVEDSASLAFLYHNQTLQTHSHTWGFRGFRAQMEFVSDEVDLLLDLGRGKVCGTVAGQEVSFEAPDALYRTELEAFVHAIADKRPELIRCTYADSMGSLKLALSASEALEQQCVVEIPR
ncbi:MAG: Gfo/Idh/MocA family oxidoreductase [Alicyclobacillus sp.]|nr:Gfo/Idh/MocA family oxidoreductase [Alicyclobacillus sp.]